MLVRRTDFAVSRREFMDWTDREILNVYCRPDMGDEETGYHPAPMKTEADVAPRRPLSWYEVFTMSVGKAMAKAGKTAEEIKARWKEYISKLKSGKTSGDPEIDKVNHDEASGVRGSPEGAEGCDRQHQEHDRGHLEDRIRRELDAERSRI